MRYKKLCYICGVKSCHEIETKRVGNGGDTKARRLKALVGGWLTENEALQAERKSRLFCGVFFSNVNLVPIIRESLPPETLCGVT